MLINPLYFCVVHSGSPCILIDSATVNPLLIWRSETVVSIAHRSSSQGLSVAIPGWPGPLDAPHVGIPYRTLDWPAEKTERRWVCVRVLSQPVQPAHTESLLLMTSSLLLLTSPEYDQLLMAAASQFQRFSVHYICKTLRHDQPSEGSYTAAANGGWWAKKGRVYGRCPFVHYSVLVCALYPVDLQKLNTKVDNFIRICLVPGRSFMTMPNMCVWKGVGESYH